MLIIEPGQQFLLTQKLNNPSDSNTYYVQAKIYNAVSGALLSTVNLTDKGNKYYSKLWVAPTDGTVNGLQIVVFTTAYTDSGYTTESTIYGTNVVTYIVRHLPTNNLGGFTTQQAPISYEAIEKLIERQLAKLPQPKDPDAYDDAELKKAIEAGHEDYARRMVEIEEYVGNRIDQAVSRLEGQLDGRISRIKDAVASLLDNASAADVKTDEKLSSQLEEVKQGIEAILTDERLDSHFEELHGTLDEKHDEMMEQLRQPLEVTKQELYTMHRPKGKADQKKEAQAEQEENAKSERSMTINKLLNLP